MSILTDLIRWVTGSNGRTKEVKQNEEETVQHLKDETLINLGRSKTNFRRMKQGYQEDI